MGQQKSSSRLSLYCLFALLVISQGDDNETQERNSSASRIRHPVGSPIAMSFRPPMFTACEATKIIVHVWGLTEGVHYGIAVIVRRGTHPVHNSNFGIKIQAHPDSAKHFDIHIPPLQACQHSLRVTITDVNSHISAEDSFLSTSIQKLHVLMNAALGPEQENQCPEFNLQSQVIRIFVVPETIAQVRVFSVHSEPAAFFLVQFSAKLW